MTGRSANRFSWRLTAGAATLGLVFAALTITGSIPDLSATQRVALGMLALIGVASALEAPDRPFVSGFAAGFLAGLVAIETQALFLGTYFANNPQFADVEMPFGWPPRLATAVLGPLNAVVAGVITGVLAWVFRKVSAVRSSPRRS